MGKKTAIGKVKQNQPLDYTGQSDRTGEEKEWVLGQMGSVWKLN